MIKFKKLGPEVAERLHHLPQIFSEYAEVVVVHLFGSFAKEDGCWILVFFTTYPHHN